MHIFNAIADADMVPRFFDKTGILLNVLIAYCYVKSQAFKLTDMYREMINLLYLDSGAYSVSTGKSHIETYGYRHYLKKYGLKFDGCFNLDDRFDDPYHNFINQAYLEDNLSMVPIPVVHDSVDPFGEFETYAGLGHSFIAIGSSGSVAVKDRLLTKAKEKYPDVKIHLFGDLDRTLLEKHRPYSADSASWAHQAGKGGGIYYWRPSENKSYRYNIGARESVKGSQHIKLSPFWEEIQAFLYDTFRYEYNDLQNYEVRWILNFYYNHQYESYLNSLDEK